MVRLERTVLCAGTFLFLDGGCQLSHEGASPDIFGSRSGSEFGESRFPSQNLLKGERIRTLRPSNSEHFGLLKHDRTSRDLTIGYLKSDFSKSGVSPKHG